MKNFKTKLVSVRIPDYVDDFIEHIGVHWIGKDKTKTDFINEAIKLYCYYSLLMIEDKFGRKGFKVTQTDVDSGKEKELGFDEYLNLFK